MVPWRSTPVYLQRCSESRNRTMLNNHRFHVSGYLIGTDARAVRTTEESRRTSPTKRVARRKS
eukprot:7980381-Pyramimonas_sp.AAC.1